MKCQYNTYLILQRSTFISMGRGKLYNLFLRKVYNERQYFSSTNFLFSSTTPSSLDVKKNRETSERINYINSSLTAGQYIHALSELSKARLSTLVVSTSTCGYFAAGVPTSYTTLAACCVGTALCSSCASTLNQIIEVERDSRMVRTSNRPLVQKTVVSMKSAYVIASCMGLAGGTVLFYGTEIITFSLGVGNIALYAGIYTYLKPRSEWNTWVGALVGAIPPVMGYTSATCGEGLCDIEVAILGATLFLWQFPHFFSLSWMHRNDYAKGGFKMVTTSDNERGDTTSKLITKYSFYLSVMPIISTLFEVTNGVFVIEGFILNGYAIHVSKKFDKNRNNFNARKVFRTSLWYLPVWMMLFLLHSKKLQIGNKNKGDEEDRRVYKWCVHWKRKLRKVYYEDKHL